MSRDAAKEVLVELGARATDKVSKNTDYVIIGSRPGAKAEIAKALGIATMTEDEFLRLINEAYRA